MTTTRPRQLAALAAAAVLALTASACSSDGSGSTASASGEPGGLVISTGSTGQFSANFNPFLLSTALQPTQGVIYESLEYHNKARDDDPVPMLATEATWNDDGTVLSITTREGVIWSDGEPFTAEDVVFTFNLLTEYPALNAVGFDGTAELVDATHLTVSYDEPSLMDGDTLLAEQLIVPGHVWKDVEDPTTFANADPVGTGPFVLTDFAAETFTMERNETYWQADTVEVPELRYVALNGNTSALDTFLAGDIDWMSTSVPSIDQVLGGEEDVDYSAFHFMQTVLMTCSNADLGCTGAQTDPAVRQAVYYGIDRDQVNTLGFSGTGEDVSPTFALLPRDEALIADSIAEPVAPTSAQPDKVASVMTAAGWTKGSDGIYAKDGVRASMEITTVTGWTDYTAAIDTMADQLQQVGIEVVGHEVSQNEWLQAKADGGFELLIDALGQGASADPYYVYASAFASRGTAEVGGTATSDYARYSNPDVDAALEQLNALQDDAARAEQYAVIQEAIVADMPYIPLITGATQTEYRTDEWQGFPTEDDPYAINPTWGGISTAQILMHLTPVG